MSLKNNCTLLDITVQPKSSRSEIKVQDSLIKVYLHSPPADGKANEECISLFSKALRVPRSCINIEKGEHGRHKRISIEGISADDAIKKLTMKGV
ncbi:MAG: DUF167 domain-containing protein [Spirochaetota bacterium]